MQQLCDCLSTENNVPYGFACEWVAEVNHVHLCSNLEMEIRSERCNHCDNAL
ncbi:MAG: hypothetical protein R2744_10145 [Bacteroidales bacterium]